MINVIPAQAGIHKSLKTIGSRLRGNDVNQRYARYSGMRAAHGRQNIGVNNTSRVKISSRPNSMAKHKTPMAVSLTVL